MSDTTGDFIWYELMSPDPDASARFYNAVIGWSIAIGASPQPGGMDYRMIVRPDGGSAGGVMALSPQMLAQGASASWVAYLQVPDVDAAIAAITADGGRSLMPKMALPVGEIAMVTDPCGAAFYVMAPIAPPDRPDAVSDVFDPARAAHVRWNELSTPEPERAIAFYGRHFGFRFDERMPMGPVLGDYHFIDRAGRRLGGLMRHADPAQAAGWNFTMGVPSVTAARQAIAAAGGTVVAEPHQVPGGEWVVRARDPHGARFGVVGPLAA